MGTQLSALIGSDLSSQIFLKSLYQPYKVHIDRNSSDVLASATTHITSTVAVVNFFTQLATSFIISIFILTTLLFLDIKLTFSCISIFVIAYIFLGTKVRNKLLKNSKLVSSFEKLQLKSLSEGLGAIRDILLNGSQKIYYEGYKKTDKSLRLSIAQSQFLANFPRFTFETLGFIGDMFLSYTLSINSDENLTIIPVLGTFVGAQRLYLLYSKCMVPGLV